MNYSKVIIFDISGEYGHFRKFNTTTSPLTYSLPTPTAVYGMLGAILGIEREDSQGRIPEGKEYLNAIFSSHNTEIAIRPLANVKKVNMGFNLLNTANGKDSYFNIAYEKNKYGRTQIEYEILKDPVFRIYLKWEHELRPELIRRLKSKEFYFNPYLGISQMTADINWAKESELRKIANSDYLEFISAVNISEINSDRSPIEIDTIYDKVFHVETVPVEMGIDRRIHRYGEVLVELNGQTVKALPNKKSFFIEDEGNIQFL